MVSFLIVPIHIAINVSVFLFLNVSKTHKGITLKIFSENAMVSLLLIGFSFYSFSKLPSKGTHLVNQFLSSC